LFGYETRNVIAELVNAGHEIGVHVEPVDLAAVLTQRPIDALVHQIELFKTLVPNARGVASHNDLTPYDNLKFLNSKEAQKYIADMGMYEAYSSTLGLFQLGTYITDSYKFFWRVFKGGKLELEHSCICDLIETDPSTMYILIHPHLWYRQEFHLRLSSAQV
jgi:hypothetical protein